MKLLRGHAALVVCGETGSGKTTQLPKMAMETGRGSNGRMIACTQPRRLAAVSVAERVAAELGEDVGGTVGYQHRFAKAVSNRTRIKFMTDGILLAETRTDPLLEKYDTVIVDEAHERTLNVDFLLGILKRILSRRRDLKVIVSSATLDTELFSRFFSDAPAVCVPGRLYPVETRYFFEDGEESGEGTDDHDPADMDLPRAVGAALKTLPHDFDTLVFLPGERDIRETADHLSRAPEFSRDDIIPLLASLPASEQKRAFRPSPRRRVILATNVAETSVTIPGIRAVVDSGLARISRYVHRTQIQRLQIEKISRASARQRAGRCGRVGPGTCIRLYSKRDFESREEFTPPEIMRSSLAGVILTMLDIGLDDIDGFPFIEPPRPSMVHEGLRELVELGAIRHASGVSSGPGRRPLALTAAGRSLARFPVQPRLARMLLEASRLATLGSAIPVVAAMGCDDPRRRPVDEREKADQAHARFKVKGSDFLGTLELWKWWDSCAKSLSQTQLRKLAKKTYLSYPKMREWRDAARQLEDVSRRLGLYAGKPSGGECPDAPLLHRALMSGLLSRLGHLDPQDPSTYRGARALRFAIHPSSVLAREKKSRPEWIMAGELVDTSRLYARNAAAIDPAWIEPAAGNLVKRSYSNPCWDAESGFVRATEQVTLFGLVVVPARRRDFSKIDPAKSREIFILHALVLGEMREKRGVLGDNAAVIAELDALSERLRSPELFDIARLSAHFDASLPGEIVSIPALHKWLSRAAPRELERFALKRAEWIPASAPASDAFPEAIRIAGAKITLSYRHAPDDPESDGITAKVRKSDTAVLRRWRADWLVPGALPRKVSYIVSSLPSSYRRALPPVSDTVSIIFPLLKGKNMPLEDAIRDVVLRRFGIKIPFSVFTSMALPAHLKVRFAVTSDDGKTILATSRDLDEILKDEPPAPPPLHPAPIPPSVKKAAGEIEKEFRLVLLEARRLPQDIYDAIETQIAFLSYPGWERLVPSERLADYPRYIKAMRIRMDRARTNPSGDRSKEARFEPYWTQYTELVSSKSAKIADRAALAEYRWLLEEYRISLFAQEVGTRAKASPNTLSALWIRATDD